MPRGQTFGGGGGNTSATVQLLTGTMPLTVCTPLSIRLKDTVRPDGGPHVTVIGNVMGGSGVVGVSFMIFLVTMSEPVCRQGPGTSGGGQICGTHFPPSITLPCGHAQE